MVANYWYAVTQRGDNRVFMYACYDECGVLHTRIEFSPGYAPSNYTVVVGGGLFEASQQAYWYEDMCEGGEINEKLNSVWTCTLVTEEEVLLFCIENGIVISK